MNYLIKTTEVWKVADNAAADLLEDEFRKEFDKYTVVIFKKTEKNRKIKGEIVEEWVQVDCTKLFNDMKEPDSHVKPKYE